MASTYEPIATQTLASAATSITFSSIAATYTDLRLVLVAPSESADGNDFYLRFNSDSTTNYSGTSIDGPGATASSAKYTTSAQMLLAFQYGYTSTTYPMMITSDIFSYAGSTYKTCLNTFSGDRNGTGGATTRNVGLWRSTSAITSIQLFISSSLTFSTGTTATLYGIAKA